MRDLEEYIRITGAAAITEISARVIEGEEFQSAKSAVVKALLKNQTINHSELQTLRTCLYAIEPSELTNPAILAMKERNLLAIENVRGSKIGIIERIFYRFTGMVFK